MWSRSLTTPLAINHVKEGRSVLRNPPVHTPAAGSEELTVVLRGEGGERLVQAVAADDESLERWRI